MAGTYRLARTRCTNPSCRTETVEVVEDAVHTLICSNCRQYNPVLSREAIASGRCSRCKKPLDDDHKWQGEYAVCKVR